MLRGIKYISFHERSGYGEAAQRYMSGLRSAGIAFTWTPMVPGRRWGLGYEPFEGWDIDSPFAPFCNAPLDYDAVVVHTVPEYFPLWRSVERRKRLIGVTVWETDRPPAKWIPLLNGVDRIVVPCRWNRDVFQEHGVTVPIDVVPYIACRSSLPAIDRAERFGARAGDCCFYTINAWTARKAIWDTIAAYLAAFTADDPVVLIIKTTPGDHTRRAWFGKRRGTRQTIQRILRRHERPARLLLLTDTMSDEGILELHAAGDCYVSLTHSEGWGLGAFDAAAFGRPVIMTGFGGQLDYLEPDAAYLVDYQLIPVQDRRGRDSYSSDQRWAQPDLGQAAQFMRQVLADRPSALARGMLLQQRIREQFGEAALTAKLAAAAGYCG
jgi:glycosyltransferase involved in cell wall biosynthesis